jgi:hypothetical protein
MTNAQKKFIPDLTALAKATKGLDRFARLLATEDILVEHRAIPTAFFDLKNRLLALPMWKDMKESLYHMLVLHETGHALFTPCDGWEIVVNDADKYLRHYVNVVEDARIDRKMKAKFPGGRSDYQESAGYLVEQDFFEMAGKDLHSYSFIDRLNIHFKVGSIVDVPFADDERPFLLRMETTTSFDDVVKLSREILQFAKDRRDKMLEMSDLMFGQGDMMDIMQGKGRGQPGDYGDDVADAFGQGAGGFNHKDIDSTTQDALDRNITKNHIDSRHLKDIPYIDVPSISEWRDFVFSHKDLLGAFNTDFARVLNGAGAERGSIIRDGMTRRYMEFMNRNNKAVAYMVKEFEMKKAADAYSRARESKTGVINPNKVHSYRYAEDIFRRLTTLPEGKNHGMVMFIDFSGSMSINMNGTIQQLLSLVEFCRRVGIAHEVYGFVSSWRAFAGHDKAVVRQIKSKAKTLSVQKHDLRLLELFTHKMSRREYVEMGKFLHEFGAQSCDRDYNNQQMYYRTSTISLGSTPLNQTIILAHHIIDEFRTKNKLDVTHSVLLTDGESDGSSIIEKVDSYGNAVSTSMAHDDMILRDPRTRHQEYVTNTSDVTGFLVRNMRSHLGINVAIFRIVDGPGEAAEYSTKNVAEQNRIAGEFRKNKFVSIPGGLGASEFFAIGGGKNLNVEDAEMEDFGDMRVTNNKLAKAFIKANTKRTTSRAMLTKFIDMIAGKARKIAIDKMTRA